MKSQPQPNHPNYLILHRTPQLPGDPTFALAKDATHPDAIALFFSLIDAQNYLDYLNASHTSKHLPQPNTPTPSQPPNSPNPRK